MRSTRSGRCATLRPARPRRRGPPDPPFVQGARPLVAVFGLAGGCGATVVARAVAAELAARDASGTAAVACESRPGGLPLATKAASRLARALEDLPGGARALGRSVPAARRRARLARRRPPRSRPARDRRRLVVARRRPGVHRGPHADSHDAGDRADARARRNRMRGPGRPGADARDEPGRHADDLIGAARATPASPTPRSAGPGAAHDYAGPAVALPESRFGAQLALGGREARGALGRAIAGLVDGWEGGV